MLCMVLLVYTAQKITTLVFYVAAKGQDKACLALTCVFQHSLNRATPARSWPQCYLHLAAQPEVCTIQGANPPWQYSRMLHVCEMAVCTYICWKDSACEQCANTVPDVDAALLR